MAITFGRPCKTNLQKCRGLETPDINLLIILVKESVESTAGAYRFLKGMNLWKKNIYNQEIVIHQKSTFVFKLQGHLWSIIFKPLLSINSILEIEDAQGISEMLGTDTIYCVVSDTSGITHYQLFSNGTLVERLYSENGTTEFISQRQPINVNEIRPYKFLNDFIQEQNSYIPMLIGDYPRDEQKFVLGNRTILTFENLFPSEVYRMDYLAQNTT
ncbi:MAG: hypothetical protein ACFBSE_13945 [Prochloraceae cyanobacterium]